MTINNRKQFFDDIAAKWHKEHCNKKNKVSLQEMVKQFRLRENARILDIGCGTGRLIPHILAEIGGKGCLVEADFSEKMLKIGEHTNRSTNVLFLQADAQLLGLRNQTFDMIIGFALFPHLTNHIIALNEFHRILKSQGTMIIAHQMSRHELNHFHHGIGGPVKKDRLPCATKMKALFRSAGFKKIEITDKPSLYIARAMA